MKWFKHYSDNHRGQSVNALMDKLGYFGPFLYYTIYELCAEKLEKELDRDMSYSDCIFRFHRRVICSATRAKPSSVASGLLLGQSCGLWSCEIDGDYFEIKIPILLDLLDSDQKKTRSKRAKNATNTRLDKEEDKEEDKDYKAAAVLKINDEVFATYQFTEGYPRNIFDEYAREAWPLFFADDNPNKKWKRFLANYIKNNKHRIRDHMVELSKADKPISAYMKEFFQDEPNV